MAAAVDDHIRRQFSLSLSRRTRAFFLPAVSFFFFRQRLIHFISLLFKCRKMFHFLCDMTLVDLAFWLFPSFFFLFFFDNESFFFFFFFFSWVSFSVSFLVCGAFSRFAQVRKLSPGRDKKEMGKKPIPYENEKC